MASEGVVPRKLWEHQNPQSTQMWKFLKAMEKMTGLTLPDYEALCKYSRDCSSDFWRHCFNYLPIVYSGTIPDRVVDETARIDSIPKWFQGVKMNFAENVLFCGDASGRASLSPGKEDDKIACTEVREGSFLEPIRQISWRELRHKVGRCEQAMKAHGIKKGDRVAVVSSTSLDTLTVLLAVTALGGIFSSSSTDMGVRGILDRLRQIRPKLVFMDDKALYNGKKIDLRQKMTDIVNGMEDIGEFQGVIAQPDGKIRQLIRRLFPVALPGTTSSQRPLPQSSSSSNLTFLIHSLLYIPRGRQANRNALSMVSVGSF